MPTPGRDVEKFSKLAEAYETEHSLGSIDEIADVRRFPEQIIRP